MMFNLSCVMVVVISALCIADNATQNNSMPSSSYARVQYASNNNSVIRRLGARRDPTIQYVTSDDLQDKYNADSNYGLKTDAVGDERLGVNVDANKATTTKTFIRENTPDLTNNWTIEKQPTTTTTTISFSSHISRDLNDQQAAKNTNKASDYVYTHSNAYNAYSEHDNFPERNSVNKPKPVTSTAHSPPRINNHADQPNLGTTERAQYMNADESVMHTSSVVPPTMMEPSWTDQRIPDTFFPIQTKQSSHVDDKNPGMETSFEKVLPEHEQVQRNGVQSKWVPFGSRTSNVNDNPKETLSHDDTRRENTVLNNAEQQDAFGNIPVFDQMQNVGRPQMMAETDSTNVVFPSPMENEINRGNTPQLSSFQPSASNSAEGFDDNERIPSNNFQKFESNDNRRFERPMQQQLPFVPSEPSNNDRPINFQQSKRHQFLPHQQSLSWASDNDDNAQRPSFQVRGPQLQQPERPKRPSGPFGLPPQFQNQLPESLIFFNPTAHNDDRVDGPQTQNRVRPFNANFNRIHSDDGRPPIQHQFGQPNHFPLNFRPPPQHFRPHFMTPPPTTTATSLIKSFIKKIFPFSSRSIKNDDDIPIVDDGVSMELNRTTALTPKV